MTSHLAVITSHLISMYIEESAKIVPNSFFHKLFSASSLLQHLSLQADWPVIGWSLGADAEGTKEITAGGVFSFLNKYTILRSKAMGIAIFVHPASPLT